MQSRLKASALQHALHRVTVGFAKIGEADHGDGKWFHQDRFAYGLSFLSGNSEGIRSLSRSHEATARADSRYASGFACIPRWTGQFKGTHTVNECLRWGDQAISAWSRANSWRNQSPA
jgi:hypothetical protein